TSTPSSAPSTIACSPSSPTTRSSCPATATTPRSARSDPICRSGSTGAGDRAPVRPAAGRRDTRPHHRPPGHTAARPPHPGDSPFAAGRTFRPLVAREGGDIVARGVALVDQRYLDRWDDGVGHLVMFEALPGARDATKQLVDTACDWLREQGMTAARAGFGG